MELIFHWGGTYKKRIEMFKRSAMGSANNIGVAALKNQAVNPSGLVAVLPTEASVLKVVDASMIEVLSTMFDRELNNVRLFKTP